MLPTILVATVGAVASTVIVAVCEIPFSVVAVIVVVPSATPVTVPFDDTVAMFALLLDHVIAFCSVVPSGVIVAFNFTVFFPVTTPIVDVAGVTLNAVGVFITFTVIVFVIGFPDISVAELVTVIVAVPGFNAVIDIVLPETVAVAIVESLKTAKALVPDDMYLKAIGKKGYNAKLAVKLTDWKIDVKKMSEENGENY